jgi:hypothetical protein
MIRQLTNNNAKLSLTSAPTTGDRMREGKFWLKQDTNELYALLDVTGGVATWDKVLTANSTLPMDTQTDPLVDTALVTAVLDAYSGVIILTTGAGADQTFGVPTNTDPGSRFWVVNDDSSSHSFDVIGARTITIDPGEAEQYMWDGDAWIHITAADAEDITFNPAVSYLSDTNVQSAIDSFAPTTEGIVEASRALVSDSNLDLNFSGGYLLNDQTTTNMMSKGTVYRFDGVDDYITVTDGPNVNFGTGDFSFHIKYTPENVTDAQVYLVSKGAAGVDYGIELRTNDLWIRFDDATADASAVIGTDVFTAGTEYDIVVTFDRSGNATGYVDGVAVGTVDISSVFRTITTGSALKIGARVDNNLLFNGSIGLVEAYNTALSASEVKDLISGNIPFKWQYGSQTSTVTGDDSDFDTDTGNWLDFSGGVFTGVVGDWAGAGGTGIGKITYDTGGSWSGVRIAGVFTIGQEVTVRLQAKLLTGASFSPYIGDGTDYTIGGHFTPTGTETYYEATFIASHADMYLNADGAAGQVMLIDNVTVIYKGAVALYTQDSISDGYWYDVSGNDNHGTKTGAEVLSYKGWHSDGTDLYTDGAATFGGHVRIPATKYLYLDGGSNTYLHEVSADKLDIVVGNYTMMSFDEQSSPKLIYINPSTSEDMDFAVGSNAGVNAIYVDGTDASSTFGGDVGIGGSADLLSAGTAATVATIQGLTTNRGRLEIASATVTGSGVVGDIQFVRGVDNVASVECSLDGADDAGVISFYTQPTGDVATKRWSILSNGTFEGTGARTIQTTSNNLLTLNGGTGGVSIGDKLILPTSSTPASAGATGVAGTVAWDANYIYVCSATNTWLRAAIATW